MSFPHWSPLDNGPFLQILKRFAKYLVRSSPFMTVLRLISLHEWEHLAFFRLYFDFFSPSSIVFEGPFSNPFQVMELEWVRSSGSFVILFPLHVRWARRAPSKGFSMRTKECGESFAKLARGAFQGARLRWDFPTEPIFPSCLPFEPLSRRGFPFLELGISPTRP